MLYHLCFTIFVSVYLCVPAADLTLNVTPFMQAAQPGEDVEFVCSDPENETLSYYVKWSRENQENTSVIPEFGRVRAVNGTLTITNISHQDAGTYRCGDDFGSGTETGVLKVYDMPGYLKDGLIIAGVCLGLTLVLLANMWYAKVRARRQKKWRSLEAEKRFRKLKNYKGNIN